MARYDFRTPRLFVDDDLSGDARLTLGGMQANYLRNVLHLGAGDAVLLFNGRDGEWRGVLAEASRKTVLIDLEERTRVQEPLPDLHYLFAPLKQARLDYVVQKAAEMGAGRLRPVLTHHTQVRRLNLDRARANVREACEQCGVITVPAVDTPVDLEDVLSGWEAGRVLIVADEAESAGPEGPLARLSSIDRATPLAVLIGPEGGFSADERHRLAAHPSVIRIALGPRILRADTAAVAALALVQTAAGDWANGPPEGTSVP